MDSLNTKPRSLVLSKFRLEGNQPNVTPHYSLTSKNNMMVRPKGIGMNVAVRKKGIGMNNEVS